MAEMMCDTDTLNFCYAILLENHLEMFTKSN